MAAPGRPDPTLIAEVVGVLGDAEVYGFVSAAEEQAYLERRARSLHRLVDALGDEVSRYLPLPGAGCRGPGPPAPLRSGQSVGSTGQYARGSGQSSPSRGIRTSTASRMLPSTA